MNKNFNYNHLYYFYVTVTSGGVSQAAEKLNTSQSSLSIQLKTLEESLDRKLFRREGRRLVMTTEGERIFFYCKAAFSTFENLSHYLRSSDFGVGTRVNFGVSDEIERPFVTDIISQIFQGSPSMGLNSFGLLSLSHEQLTLKLESRELDALLTNRPMQVPGVLRLAEFKLPVALVGQKRLFSSATEGAVPFLRRSSLAISTVSRDHLFRLEVENFLGRRRLQKNILFESNVFAAITRSLVAGLAVGFVPLPYVRSEIDAGKLTVLGSPSLWKHSLYLFGRTPDLKKSWIQQFGRAVEKLSLPSSKSI